MSIAPADLFLSAQLTEEDASRFLERFGFRNPAEADRQLQALAADFSVRQALGDLAGGLLEALGSAADPDGALSAFVHYVSTRSPAAGFIRYLTEDPRALGVLIEVAGSSPHLTDCLIANPESFHWLVREIERYPPDAWELGEEADRLMARATTAGDRRDVLRQFRERETLRIGARQILGHETADASFEQLVALREIVIGRALLIAREAVGPGVPRSADPGRFCVIATRRRSPCGVDYDAPAEIIYLTAGEGREGDGVDAFFSVLGHMLTAILTGDETERPLQYVQHPGWFATGDGSSVRSVASCLHDVDLANDTARVWLSQARPIAGDLELGRHFLERVVPSPACYRAPAAT